MSILDIIARGGNIGGAIQQGQAIKRNRLANMLAEKQLQEFDQQAPTRSKLSELALQGKEVGLQGQKLQQEFTQGRLDALDQDMLLKADQAKQGQILNQANQLAATVSQLPDEQVMPFLQSQNVDVTPYQGLTPDVVRADLLGKSSHAKELVKQALTPEKFGQPVAGVDPETGKEVFTRFGTKGAQQRVEGVTPRPKVPLVQIGGDIAPEDKARGHIEGVPLSKRNPWDNIRDPKKQDDAKLKFLDTGQKQLEKDQVSSKQASDFIQDLDRFIFLNEENVTGAFAGAPGVKQIRRAFDPEFAEMQSIVDRMTPLMRQGMPGAASDKDVAMFRGGTVGVDKPEEANIRIAEGLKISRQNMIDRTQFRQEYLSTNQHLVGSDKKWNEYIKKNPIFKPGAKLGSFELNESRQSWRDYFGGKEKAGSRLDELRKKHGL